MIFSCRGSRYPKRCWILPCHFVISSLELWVVGAGTRSLGLLFLLSNLMWSNLSKCRFRITNHILPVFFLFDLLKHFWNRRMLRIIDANVGTWSRNRYSFNLILLPSQTIKRAKWYLYFVALQKFLLEVLSWLLAKVESGSGHAQFFFGDETCLSHCRWHEWLTNQVLRYLRILAFLEQWHF